MGSCQAGSLKGASRSNDVNFCFENPPDPGFLIVIFVWHRKEQEGESVVVKEASQKDGRMD